MNWPPRDGRKLIAMAMLSGGGMALTIFAWRVTTLVAERSLNNPWPLAYSLYGSLALIGLVLISLGWVIGRSTAKGELPGGVKFDLGGGEDETETNAKVQAVADAAQVQADEVKS